METRSFSQEERIEKAKRALSLLYGDAPQGQYLCRSTFRQKAYESESVAPVTHYYRAEEFDRFVSDGIIDGDLNRLDSHMRVSTVPKAQAAHIKGVEKDSTGIGCIVVDIDPGSRTAEQIEEAVRSFHMPFTMMVNSGHGRQVYFKLKQWRVINTREDLLSVKRRVKWLHEQLGGDATHNLDRLMRFPYSNNFKYQQSVLVEVVEEHLEVEYDLEDIPEADLEDDDPEEAPDDTTVDAEIPDDFMPSLKRNKATKDLHDRMLSEVTAAAVNATPKANGRVDISKNDQWCANRLASLGYSPGLIRSAMMHPEWLFGTRYRQKKDRTYVINTVKAAFKWVKQSPLRFFKGGTFKPMKVVYELTRKHHLLRAGNDVLVYKGGVYEPSPNSQQLRELVQSLLGEESLPEFVTKVIDSCKDYEEIPVWPKIDPERYINFKNALLDVQTWKMVPHSPDVYSTLQFPVEYRTEVIFDTTAIDKYIREVLVDDCISLWWEYVGLSFWYGKPTKHLLFIQGKSNSGKNNLMKFLHAGLGKRVTTLSLDYITEERWAFGDLFGSPGNICDEMEDTIFIKAISKLKRLWSGQKTPIPAERKNEKIFYYVPTLCGFFFCNDLPNIPAFEDDGAYNRYHILRTRQVFAESAEGEAYVDGLLANHLDDFVHLAMAGLKRYIDNHNTLSETASMIADKAAYRQSANPLIDWIADKGDLNVPDGYMSTSELHVAYLDWAKEHGGHYNWSFALFSRKWAATAKQLGIEQKPKYIPELKESRNVWIGIKIRPYVDESGVLHA